MQKHKTIISEQIQTKTKQRHNVQNTNKYISYRTKTFEQHSWQEKLHKRYTSTRDTCEQSSKYVKKIANFKGN